MSKRRKNKKRKPRTPQQKKQHEHRLAIHLARQSIGKLNKLFTDKLVLIPVNQWPTGHLPETAPDPESVYRSKDYLVWVYRVGETGIYRIAACRTKIDDDGNWQSDLSWEELQRIKNEVGFRHCDAVEAFPRAEDEVNIGNCRHLWILPEQMMFAWRAGDDLSDLQFVEEPGDGFDVVEAPEESDEGPEGA